MTTAPHAQTRRRAKAIEVDAESERLLRIAQPQLYTEDLQAGRAALEAAIMTVQVGPRNAYTNEQGLRHYRWKGTDYPSVTTIRRMAGLPFGLHNWALNKVIERAISGTADLVKIIGDGSPDAIKGAGAWLRKASTEERDAAASLGTRIHDAAASGKSPTEVRADIAPSLIQYLHWLAKSRAKVLETERQVFNLKVGYAGTFDLLVELPDGRIYLVDLKTGKNTYAEHVLQCVAYASAEFVGQDDVIDDEATTSLHQVDGLAILHLSATGWKWQVIKPEVIERAWIAYRGLLVFATFCEEYPKIDGLLARTVEGAAPTVQP